MSNLNQFSVVTMAGLSIIARPCGKCALITREEWSRYNGLSFLTRTVGAVIIIINEIHFILNLDKTVIRNNYPYFLIRHPLVSGCPRNEKMLN